jgi:hypothetical protein
MKKPLRSSARGVSFHTKRASNANVVRVVLLDANSYLALWTAMTFLLEVVDYWSLNVTSYKHGRARDNKFFFTHLMTDQRCLTSAIARRSALTAGPSSSSTVKYFQSKLCFMLKCIRLKIYWWSSTVLYSLKCCWLYVRTHIVTYLHEHNGVLNFSGVDIRNCNSKLH